jgi:hypothetical protein
MISIYSLLTNIITDLFLNLKISGINFKDIDLKNKLQRAKA